MLRFASGKCFTNSNNKGIDILLFFGASKRSSGIKQIKEVWTTAGGAGHVLDILPTKSLEKEILSFSRDSA